MSDIKFFYNDIPNKETLSLSALIPYFVYYCETTMSEVKAINISSCFSELRIKPYSNISQYLKQNSDKKNSLFLKTKNGYVLSLNAKEKIKNEMDLEKEVIISKELFDLSIIEKIPNIPYYIIIIAKEMCGCYDCGLYTACLGMMRKLIETLIIEQFEKYNLDSEIKDNNGNFYHLSVLIEKYESSINWNASVNLKKSFKNIKKYGDLSVHNRRFFAKKSDIDNLKSDMRIAIQEIILAIDYSNLQIN